MKQQINPLVAGILIVGVVALIGFFYWKATQDAPIPDHENPMSRIGRTMNLGKTKKEPPAEGKHQPAESKLKNSKPDESSKDSQTSK